MAGIRSKLAAGGLLVALVSTSAGAGGPCRVISGLDTPDDPSDDVSVCRQDVWFHKADPPVGNAAAYGAGAFPSWNASAPTDSVTSGAGGGYVGTSTFHQTGSPWDPQGTVVFEGTFTGDIDTLGVTLFLVVPGKTADATLPTNIQLLVDGESVFEADDKSVVLSAGGQVAKKIDFALTNIYALLKDLNLAGPGRDHALRLSVVGTGLATGGGLWVYDTSEVPSGMVFNVAPEDLAGYTVIQVY